MRRTVDVDGEVHESVDKFIIIEDIKKQFVNNGPSSDEEITHTRPVSCSFTMQKSSLDGPAMNNTSTGQAGVWTDN